MRKGAARRARAESSEDSESEDELQARRRPPPPPPPPQQQQQQQQGRGKQRARQEQAQAQDQEGQGQEKEDDEVDELEQDEERIVLAAPAPGERAPGDSDSEEAEDVNVEFEFCDPREDDFLMVKSLMSQGTVGLVPGMAAHLSELAEDICAQAACGTTVVVDGHVYTFVSALSGSHYAEKAYMRALRAAVDSACPASMRAALSKALGEGFAWLISERLVNMPNDIVPPLYQAICDDLAWARDNVGETGGSADMFDFKYALFLAPCYAGKDKDEINNESDGADSDGADSEEEADEAAPRAGKAKAKGQGGAEAKRAKITDFNDVLFAHFEQELLIKSAAVAFPVELATPVAMTGKAKGMVPGRHKPKTAIAGVISLAKLDQLLPSIKGMLDGEAGEAGAAATS
jgi:hypothetical protein